MISETLGFGNLKNNDSLIMDILKILTHSYATYKVKFIKSVSDVFKIIIVDMFFQNFNFCLKAQILKLVTIVLSLFSVK